MDETKAHVNAARTQLGIPKAAAEALRNVKYPATEPLPAEFQRFLNRCLVDLSPAGRTYFSEISAALRRREVGQSAATVLGALFTADGVCAGITDKNATFAATIPIVLESNNSDPLEQIGSGVLLRIVDQVFLLTAAHVTDSADRGTLLMPGANGFMPINGRYSGMRMPSSGRREDDRLDVAFVRLDSDCISNIHPHCLVLDRPEVLLAHGPSRQMIYSFAGFPWRQGTVAAKSIETPLSTLTSTAIPEQAYGQNGLNPNRHIAIRFRRRRALHMGKRRVIMSPLPHGMSGGGIYAWTPTVLSESDIRLPLAGIATEYHPDRNLVIGTRIEVYVNCIFHMHPELAAPAPW